jgi:hypothetical protein
MYVELAQSRQQQNRVKATTKRSTRSALAQSLLLASTKLRPKAALRSSNHLLWIRFLILSHPSFTPLQERLENVIDGLSIRVELSLRFGLRLDLGLAFRRECRFHLRSDVRRGLGLCLSL